MKLATLRRSRPITELPGVIGTARLDRHTKRLLGRLRPGDVAVIDHVDLDRVSAESLLACRVAGVVNASPSISGRYPNLGPEILVAAGVPVLDDVGGEVFGALRDGVRVRLHADTLYVGDQVVATGRAQTGETVAAALLDAKAGLSAQLEAFAANTVEYMKTERALLLDGVGVPAIRTRIEGRHALVVVRGHDYRTDLAGLRRYVREHRPVLIGVDGGADVLRGAGYRPDLVVGDLDSVSDEVLRSGAEVVVRAHPDGRAPGLERVHDLGVDAALFPAAGTSADIALLLAHANGAALIVTVGTQATLLELLDSNRTGLASTFLTRLRIGGTLVDAKAVGRLYRTRTSVLPVLLLVFSALVAIGAAAVVGSSGGRGYLTQLAGWWDPVLAWARGLFQ